MKTSNVTMRLSTVLSVMILTLVACTSAAEKQKAASGVPTPDIDIHTAVVTNNLEVVKQHILAGTDLNQAEPFGGSTPLISAGVFGRDEIAKVLIEAGVDLNKVNNDGSTALHTAAFFGRPEIVKLLLDKGADKTIRNKYGATAYESVALPFEEVKAAYDMMGTMLAPMGLKLDYAHLERVRPEIAAMLQ